MFKLGKITLCSADFRRLRYSKFYGIEVTLHLSINRFQSLKPTQSGAVPNEDSESEFLQLTFEYVNVFQFQLGLITNHDLRKSLHDFLVTIQRNPKQVPVLLTQKPNMCNVYMQIAIDITFFRCKFLEHLSYTLCV